MVSISIECRIKLLTWSVCHLDYSYANLTIIQQVNIVLSLDHKNFLGSDLVNNNMSYGSTLPVISINLIQLPILFKY